MRRLKLKIIFSINYEKNTFKFKYLEISCKYEAKKLTYKFELNVVY